MDMQDKEFDRLFNSKLSDLEMEPSPMVWDNIASELHGKKTKRGLVPYLSIAASVLVLASAGWLFFRPVEKINLKPYKGDKVVVNVEAPAGTPEVGQEAGNPTEVTNARVDQITNVAQRAAKHAPGINNIEPAQQSVSTSATVDVNTPGKVEQPVLAAITPKVQEQQMMTVPDKGTPLAITTVTTEQITTITDVNDESARPAKRHGIRSLGGLINAIVAKVDKRQDKLIEFTEDEDEGSNITGVNLGLLKIKKQ